MGLGQGTLILMLGAGLLSASGAHGWTILTVILTPVVYPTSSYLKYVDGWLAICFVLLAGVRDAATPPLLGVAFVINALAVIDAITAAFAVNKS
ncbi:hypothetical protein [Halorubrum sp. Boch-26]|uniref:hypothetical protein n=1 Tax=Halorubrum sp. Boch-26 TaxID=2994426 RepID=UPI002468F2FD|nr:hypothetical protein [Halorubrum sp. Boch-26]